jgi:ubiquinone/menaquinone biosynthesis C-methylase UbiE
MTRKNHLVSLREGYAIWASSYDEEKNPLILTEQPRVEALVECLPSPSTVLDVATGTGRWALYWARRGAEVTAVDQSPEMLAVAREKARAAGLHITFREARLEDGLPFPDGAFDLVICALALSHYSAIESATQELARVLHPGGHLLITDFHPQAILNGWEPTIVCGDDAYILPSARHTRESYLGAIAATGCETLHLEEVLVREQDPETILVDDVDAFLEKHGDWPMCLIVLARKPA